MEIRSKRPSHQDLKKKALENPEVKKEYERLKPIYEAIRSSIRKMKEPHSISDSSKNNL